MHIDCFDNNLKLNIIIIIIYIIMSVKLSYNNFLDKNEFSYNIIDGKIVFNTLKSKVTQPLTYFYLGNNCGNKQFR